MDAGSQASAAYRRFASALLHSSLEQKHSARLARMWCKNVAKTDSGNRLTGRVDCCGGCHVSSDGGGKRQEMKRRWRWRTIRLESPPLETVYAPLGLARKTRSNSPHSHRRARSKTNLDPNGRPNQRFASTVCCTMGFLSAFLCFFPFFPRRKK